MGGGYLVMTDKLKDDPEKQKTIIEMLNAMMDPYNNFVIINGLEGVL